MACLGGCVTFAQASDQPTLLHSGAHDTAKKSNDTLAICINESTNQLPQDMPIDTGCLESWEDANWVKDSMDTDVGNSDASKQVAPEIPSDISGKFNNPGELKWIVSELSTDGSEDCDTVTRTGDSESISRSKSKLMCSAKIIGTKESNGVFYYCLQVPETKDSYATVMRSFADFVELDRALAASRSLTRGVFPREEFFGLRRMLREDRFLQNRQDKLQRYLDIITGQGLESAMDEDFQEFLHRRSSLTRNLHAIKQLPA